MQVHNIREDALAICNDCIICPSASARDQFGVETNPPYVMSREGETVVITKIISMVCMNSFPQRLAVMSNVKQIVIPHAMFILQVVTPRMLPFCYAFDYNVHCFMNSFGAEFVHTFA